MASLNRLAWDTTTPQLMYGRRGAGGDGAHATRAAAGVRVLQLQPAATLSIPSRSETDTAGASQAPLKCSSQARQSNATGPHAPRPPASASALSPATASIPLTGHRLPSQGPDTPYRALRRTLKQNRGSSLAAYPSIPSRLQ
eukprot:6189466-Pleurochrysis_carterae.AAC.1